MRMLFLAPSSASLKFMMKPSSLRMRAISILSFEAGTSTFGCRACAALRIRVSMSATGSDVDICRSTPVILSLPAGLGHAGNLPGQRQFAKTNPAQFELTEIAARTPAAEAAVAMPALELRL